MTPEQRRRRCVELCIEAQYMDSEQYLTMMRDSASEPVRNMIDAEREKIALKVEEMGMQGFGTLAIAAAIRRGKE